MPADYPHSTLLDLATTDPAEARRRATRELEDVDNDTDASASVLWRVVGIAYRVERRPAEAAEALAKSIAAADRAGDRRLRGLGLLSLALAETYLGQSTKARATIDGAIDNLRGIERADARFQRALILQYSGAYDDALADYRVALPAFRAAGRLDWTADLLTNRGILHAYRGSHWQAGRDFERARETFAGLPDKLGVASTDHNLAWLATLRGDVVAALAGYGRAEQDLIDLDFPVDSVAMDQCEAMTAGGLFRQSADRAAMAVGELAGRGMKLAEAETSVVMAEACAYGGDAERGLPAVRKALVLLAEQDNPRWLLRAQLAHFRLNEGDGSGSQSAESMVAALEAAGFTGWAREAKILIAQYLTRHGDLDGADLLLSGLRPRDLPRELEVLWWLARAEWYRAAGRPTSAVRAARAGVRAVRGRQEIANTSEVRAHLGRRLGALAAIGIEHTIARAQPRKTLDWLEDLIWTPPPPNQSPAPEVRAVTFELRAITHELVREQVPDQLVRLRKLMGRQRELHRRLRALQERCHGGSETAVDLDLDGLLPWADLRAYAVSGGVVHLVANRQGRFTIEKLGPLAELSSSLRQLHFDMRSVMHRGGTESKLKRLNSRAAEVDRFLGLPGDGDGTEVVAYLAPVLGAVPFGVLPSLRGRRTLHATSLRIEQDRSGRPGRALAISGPGLDHSDQEALAVGDLYERGRVLHGSAATCEAVVGELARTDVAHFASHGRRSPDNPFFDALALGDGPLFTHELEWLSAAPDVVVLATCESAVEHSIGSSQRLGVMPSLDRVGVWRTVASIYELPDTDATVSVMVKLHSRLAESGDPAAALADCVLDDALSPTARVIAGSLICRGRPSPTRSA